MHYLLTVVGDTDLTVDDSEPGAVEAFNDRMKAEGRWVFAGGLTDPADASHACQRKIEVRPFDGVA
ncbi:hypothetical protein [Nocardioides hwasunensis]|uniref:YCII-related domain-containing protein n=1 Tax=Nocardioides hwasunensis TaxID=397258 RepID=A0ABR8MJV2_9ACTN|nr:hypothetical protein [Nocardioides hwasunensis]MBD3916317.1 hypothetical protein [Nocardioides hwasunensis]